MVEHVKKAVTSSTGPVPQAYPLFTIPQAVHFMWKFFRCERLTNPELAFMCANSPLTKTKRMPSGAPIPDAMKAETASPGDFPDFTSFSKLMTPFLNDEKTLTLQIVAGTNREDTRRVSLTVYVPERSTGLVRIVLTMYPDKVGAGLHYTPNEKAILYLMDEVADEAEAM